MSAILSAGRPRYQSRRLPLKSPGAKAREIRPRRASQDLKIRLDVQKWMIGCFFSASNCQSKKFYTDSFFEKTFLTVFVRLGILFFDQIRRCLGHDMFLLHPAGATEWCLCNTARKTAGNVDAAAPKASERSCKVVKVDGGGVVTNMEPQHKTSSTPEGTEKQVLGCCTNKTPQG